jgi:adenylate cyclase class 2
MQAEIEVKFVDIDIDDVRQRLQKAGATLEQPMRDMRRALIEEEQHAAENSFIRIRDEGDKVTIAYKRHPKNFADATIDGAREIETTIGDFDAAVAIFAASGWHYTTYQESRRETWRLDDAEIVIDEWPWIKPYIEIEANSEQKVKDAATKLGFGWDDAVFGSVDVIYNRDFPDMTVRGVIDIKEARFSNPSPAEFGPRREEEV